jgi:ribosomal protein S18 acetylase RimI-like enzyme
LNSRDWYQSHASADRRGCGGWPVSVPGVAKINRALGLYQRLGFRITGEDERKFYMKRDPENAASL